MKDMSKAQQEAGDKLEDEMNKCKDKISGAAAPPAAPAP
jgi:ribosome-associated translation inhibitor RaiA